MPAGNKPNYGVFVSRKSNGDSKAFFTRVGSAWNVGADGISIKLEPNVAIVNECVLFPSKDDD